MSAARPDARPDEFIMRPWAQAILEDFGAAGVMAAWAARGVRILLRRNSMSGGNPHLLRSCPPERFGQELLDLSETGRFYTRAEWEVVILGSRHESALSVRLGRT